MPARGNGFTEEGRGDTALGCNTALPAAHWDTAVSLFIIITCGGTEDTEPGRFIFECFQSSYTDCNGFSACGHFWKFIQINFWNRVQKLLLRALSFLNKNDLNQFQLAHYKNKLRSIRTPSTLNSLLYLIWINCSYVSPSDYVKLLG